MMLSITAERCLSLYQYLETKSTITTTGNSTTATLAVAAAASSSSTFTSAVSTSGHLSLNHECVVTEHRIKRPTTCKLLNELNFVREPCVQPHSPTEQYHMVVNSLEVMNVDSPRHLPIEDDEYVLLINE